MGNASFYVTSSEDTVGIDWKGTWATSTVYALNDAVYESTNGQSYLCVVAHTSGTFATDLSNSYWELLVQKGADGTGTGTVTSVATGGLATGGPITATGTVTVTKATGAEIDTGTDDTKAVTPKAVTDSTILVDADIGVNVAAESKKDFGDSGTETAGIDIGGVTYTYGLRVNDIGLNTPAEFIIHRHSTTLEPTVIGARSNSDTTGHAAITASMPLLTTYGAGWTGAEYNLFGATKYMVDSTGTISDSSSPGRMEFQVTADGATTPTTYMTVTNDKEVALAAGLTLGTDLAVADGGTGVSTLTGIVKGSGTSAFTAATAGTDYATKTGSTSPTEHISIAVSDETTALTTGTAKATFRMPYAFTLTGVRCSVTTAPTGATLTVDINEGGGTILSTKLTIDVSEKTSTTAAAAAVISDSALADDAEITIDIDQIGSTVAGAGLKVYLIGYKT